MDFYSGHQKERDIGTGDIKKGCIEEAAVRQDWMAGYGRWTFYTDSYH